MTKSELKAALDALDLEMDLRYLQFLRTMLERRDLNWYATLGEAFYGRLKDRIEALELMQDWYTS